MAYKRILVPVDGSSTSTQALSTAVQLAREGDGQLRLLHCVDELAYASLDMSPMLIQAARSNGEQVLKDARATAQSAGVPADTRLVELPGERLGDLVANEARSWQADLIVVGTHGRRGIGRVLLGSGAEQIIRSAPVPVLVIRGEEAADAAA